MSTPSRRTFLRHASLLGAAAALGVRSGRARAEAPLQWRAYRDSLVIDGAGGFGRPDRADEGPLTADELADARASGLTAVVLTLAPSGRFRFNDAAFETTVRNIAQWNDEIARHPDTLVAVRDASDLRRAKAEGKVGVIYTFQESSPLGEAVERVELFAKLGLRVLQLTHNRRNLVGDGCMEPGNAGLSEFGRRVIEQIEANRIVLDVAHGSERTQREAIAAAKRPLLISHTGCRALSDLPRNTTDDNLRALADRGGVAGMIFWPYLTKRAQPMAADLIRHIEHAIDVCGEDHVGLGTDATLSPVPRTPAFEKENRAFIAGMFEDGVFEAGRPEDLYLFLPDLNHLTRFETLAVLLGRRGHSEARIGKILGGNFARVMGEVWG